MAEHKFTNRLINETSPYLLQHAHNPVDWYPWGEEALAQSKRTDKPILLSVGYSACHWCHVMERESFEDEAIAKLMNDNFVCVKVDREERPDIDQIYMNAVQLMTGHGGWPMTVFLTPEQVPFYGGTYFPNVDRYNMPGFPRVLIAIAEAYENKRGELEESGQALLKEIQGLNNFSVVNDQINNSVLKKAYHNLAGNFDHTYGGFGRAPKFPQPMNLNFLLRMHLHTGDREALDMVEVTLDNMARGGIYDHLAGGFARYSTDEKWLVPHFEKMLYDNALLTQTYLAAYQLTDKKEYCIVIEETLNWVINEMTDKDGGFYSALDADSEGEEGKFYVWEKEEIKQILGDDATALIDYYGVTEDGNFEEQNILFVARNVEAQLAEVVAKHNMDEEALPAILARGRAKLLVERAKRVRPGCDSKVLTAWTAMMIRSFAEAATVLKRDDYLKIAIKAADFILTTNRDGKKLLRSYKDGRARFNAYQEDYAFTIDALIAVYEATFDFKWLTAAQELTDVMIEQFWDEKEGGFFFTGKDHEELITRNKDFTDNATPSGNSVAVGALLRLSHLLDRPDYEKKAATVINMLSRAVERYPGGFGYVLSDIDFYLSKPKEIAIIGHLDSADTKALLDVVYQNYLPNRVIMVTTPDNPQAKEYPLLAERRMINDQATAYVCENFACQEPVTTPAALKLQLGLK